MFDRIRCGNCKQFFAALLLASFVGIALAEDSGISGTGSASARSGFEAYFFQYYWWNIAILSLLGIILIACLKIWELKDAVKDIEELRQKEIVSRINSIPTAEADKLAKNRFLANMSHEIRTPMNAIIGFCDLMSDSQISPQLKSYVEKIRTSSRSLLHLINDILDFSKIEAGKLDFELIRCDVRQIILNVDSMLYSQTQEKGLDFTIKQEGKIPAVIMTDPFRLSQCFVNLCSNAVKFTDAGYVNFIISSFERDGKSYIRFSIKDSGNGIDKAKLQSIFEPFSQAYHIIAHKYGGTGLGLCITEKLTTLLGGTLDCISEPNRGSTFTITLPTGIANADMIESKDFQASSKSMKDMLSIKFDGKVLVAEDSLTNQLLIKIYLEKMGINVEIVENGAIAVEKASRDNYDLILMDMLMPEMDGYQAVSMLKSQGCKIPVVALTANAMKGDLEKCMDAGCDDYISKPIDRQILTKVLGRYLKVAVGNDGTYTTYGYDRSIFISRIVENRGDEETAKIAIAAFIKDGPLCIRSIEKGLDQESFNDIATYTNRLKIAATHIAADKLIEKAAALEDAAKKLDIKTSHDNYSQMKEQFDIVFEYLCPQG